MDSDRNPTNDLGREVEAHEVNTDIAPIPGIAPSNSVPHVGASIEALWRVAKATPDRLYARFEGEAITFQDLARDADTLAERLLSLGMLPGDRVVVMMQNSAAQVRVILALARVGLVWVPINARQRGSGLKYLLEHCEPGAVICDAELLAVIKETRAQINATRLFVAGGGADDSLSLEATWATPHNLTAPFPALTDLFAIMYTSGTTGPPKGVLVTNAMMAFASASVVIVTEVHDGDVLFVWEPLFHIGGAQMLFLPLVQEVTLAFVRRFSVSRFWQQVRDARATHIHYLGGILQMLLKQPPTDQDNDHNVRIAWGAGCKAEWWQEFEERFGLAIRECYGMTEASSITTISDGTAIGSVGKPVPWLQIEICDDLGQPLPSGATGEIVVTANQNGPLFHGYFQNAAATRSALRDGRLHTGDIGRLDASGNLWFLGRKSDSVRTRGENVSAWEVEDVAATHPAVADCAMIGIPSELGEQDIKLFVQLRPNHNLTLDEFQTWLVKRLATYQVPRFIAVVDQFQRTSSERIMKHLLPIAPGDVWLRGNTDQAKEQKAHASQVSPKHASERPEG